MQETDALEPLVVHHHNYVISLYWSGAWVPVAIRQRLTMDFDAIASTIWGIDENFFRKLGAGLFTEQDRVVLVTERGRTVGFSISRRIEAGGQAVLFRRYSCMYAEDQGRGLYRVLTDPLLAREREQQVGPLYLAWRTRNPVVWFKNAAMCSRVAPDLTDKRNDEDLVALAAIVCGKIYPHAKIDPAVLTVYSVYPGDSGYRADPVHPNPTLDAVFRSHPAIRSRHDALFGIGELRAAK